MISSDAYNRGPVERTVTSFRVYVRPGNSGGPVVNEDGEVVATVFASRADSNDSGYGIPSQLIQRAWPRRRTQRTREHRRVRELACTLRLPYEGPTGQR